MARPAKKTTKRKWVAINWKSLEKVDFEHAETLIDAIRQEFGELVLEAKDREQLRQQLGVDYETVSKWKTVDDVLSHVDIVDLAKKHPEALKNTLTMIFSFLANAFPVFIVASGAVAQIPDSFLSKIVQIGGILTPEHLIHATVKAMANRKVPSVTENGDLVFDEIVDDNGEEKRLLYVVCDDEVLANHIINLVEAEDDSEENGVVGTKDGTVRVVALNSKAWTEEFSDVNFDGKVLFIGNVKGIDGLINGIVAKYDKYGTVYGWLGNRAIISVNSKKALDKTSYNNMLKDLQTLPLPEKFKSDKKIKMNALTVGKILLATPILLKDGYDSAVAVKQQQILLGLSELYINHLEEFLSE